MIVGHRANAFPAGAAGYNEAMPPRSEKNSEKSGEKNSEPNGEHSLAIAPPEEPSTGASLTPQSFEKGIEELEAIVQELERGELSLEDSILLFEKGMAISNACRQQLADAEIRVEVLLRKGSKMVAEPFGAGTAPTTGRGVGDRRSLPSANLPESATGGETNNDDDIPF